MGPYGGIDPNSEHQLWARYTFKVYGGRIIPDREARLNITRWLRHMFGAAGRVRFLTTIEGPRNTVVFTAEVEAEGRAAHDPTYESYVRREWDKLVEKGWGRTAIGALHIKILAGDLQDGKPREQLIVMPSINLLNGS